MTEEEKDLQKLGIDYRVGDYVKLNSDVMRKQQLKTITGIDYNRRYEVFSFSKINKYEYGVKLLDVPAIRINCIFFKKDVSTIRKEKLIKINKFNEHC
jgi:hypothetical protein